MSDKYNTRCPNCGRFAANDHECPEYSDLDYVHVSDWDGGIVPKITYKEEDDAAFVDARMPRILTLDALLEAAEVDLSKWYVERHVINKWEVGAKLKDPVTAEVQITVEPLFQVKVWLKPRVADEFSRFLIDSAMDFVRRKAPRALPPVIGSFDRGPLVRDEPVLYVPSLYDPHIGALSWGAETGEPYDSMIAAKDYKSCVDELMKPARFYNVDRVLYVIGNDLLHVDTLGEGAKGGMTTKGTMQDIDSRLGKMADVACECLLYGIDSALAATDGYVDVVSVKGNHDAERMYLIAKFVEAFYRNEPRIRVDGGPALRKYYRYHVNLIGMTHGMEAKRDRDSLPLIMSTEASRTDWAETRFRDWLVGHHHTRFVVKWLDQFEERGIRVHALPGLTTEDFWHYQEGYKHRRSAEAHVFSSTGGHCGYHTFNLENA